MVGEVYGVHKAQPRQCRHGQRHEADQQVDADCAVRIEREDHDQDRQAELCAAEANQAPHYGDGRTRTGGG